MMAEGERIQKILARSGLASRRRAEEMISLGEVTVNGRVAKLGEKAVWGRDAIKVNGKLLHAMEPPVYFAMFKPKGVISALSDPEGRATLTDFLRAVHARVYPIGRLDFNSEGLLLLTNDGDFAEKMQKRDDIPRVYHVKVKGHPTPDQIQRLSRGMKQGPKLFKPHSVRLAERLDHKSKVEFVVMGKGVVDVKSYFEAKGLLVERITRTAVGHITIHGLEPGKLRPLKASQVNALLEQPELGVKRLAHEAERGTKGKPPAPERDAKPSRAKGLLKPVIKRVRPARVERD